MVATDDIRTTYEELVDKGVTFDGPTDGAALGNQAVFRDPDGNGLVLWEEQ